jgi:hypothetical protein
MMAVGSFSWQAPGFAFLRKWHAGCLEREYFDTWRACLLYLAIKLPGS